MSIKEFIEEKLGPVKFDKRFDKTFNALKSGDIKDLKEFIIGCKEKNIRPAVTNSGDLAFIKRLGGSRRLIILKAKAGNFKEIFLGEHKYYDYYREEIGL